MDFTDYVDTLGTALASITLIVAPLFALGAGFVVYRKIRGWFSKAK